jgi:hypothetical protein
MALEVDVLHPEGEALVEAKAGAVEKLGDEAVRGLEVIEEGEDVARGEQGREMVGQCARTRSSRWGKARSRTRR